MAQANYDLSADIHCVFWAACTDTVLVSRASNRLKYRSGFGLDSAKFIFSGLAPGQVFRRLILKVQFRLKLKIL